MPVNHVNLGPFLGVSTSLDPRWVNPMYAQDALNVRNEDGALRYRYGYKALSASAIPSGWAYTRGFWHALGYNKTTGAELEEYISIEKRSSNVRPYTVNVTTGARASITNSGATVNLNDSDWGCAVFADSAYLYNPNNTPNVYRHTIGTATSFKPMSYPSTPTVAPTYTITYGSTTAPYTTLSWAGFTNAGATYTGSAQSSGTALDGSNIRIRHSTTKQRSSVKIDLQALTAGNQDWRYNDAFMFRVFTTYMEIGVVAIRFYNSAGTAFTASHGAVYRDEERDQTYYAYFEKTDRSLWTTMRYVEIEYDININSGDSANNHIYLTPITEGGIRYGSPESGVQFGYSYYNNNTELESALSPALNLTTTSAIYGYRVDPAMPALGTWLDINAASTADTEVTHSRLYQLDNNLTGSKYRRIGELAIADLSHEVRVTHREFDDTTHPEYDRTGSKPMEGIQAACAHKSWMVWCKKGGYRNVIHSRVGIPEAMPKDIDLDEDTARGEIWTLPDNIIAAHSAGDAVIFVGDAGIWAQIGDRPSTQTPPHQLPGSQGCAGRRASCRWRSDEGTPGVAYLSKFGDTLWFAAATQSFGMNPDTGYVLIELSAGLRGKLRTHLTGSGLTVDAAQVFVDDEQDALWIVLGTRAAVLRRPSQFDGKRQWELYSYTDSIGWVASSPKRRIRFVGTAGHIYDLEWDSASSVYLDGTNRDNSQAPPSAYWLSKVHVGPNRRVNSVFIGRDDLTKTPAITIYSDRNSGTTKTIVSGDYHLRFGALQQGWEISYKTTVPEGAVIRRLSIEEHGPNSDKEAS